jgi:succinoglycan biosynthesis transport protein ExoP
MRTAGTTAGRSGEVDPSIDIFGLVEMIFRRKWLILGTAVVVVGLAFAALTVIGPRYKATARILIDPRDVNVVENELVQRGFGDNLLLVESQVEVIGSETVLGRVVEREKLAEDEEFAKATGDSAGRTPQEIALENLARATKVARSENTYVIEIAVTTREPAKSARLANAIAAAYTEDQVAASADATRNVSTSIEDRLAELQSRLREAEGKVQTYKTENNLSNPDGRLLLDTRLNDLSARLSAAVGRTAEAKSRLDVIEAAMRQRGDVSSVVSETENTTMVQLRGQLSEAQRRLAELQQVLGPRHPRAASAQAEVDQAQQAIRSESERLVAATRDAWRAAKEAEDGIAASLRSLTEQSFGTNEKMIELRELERQAQASRLVYEAFLVRARETAEQENLGARNARIIAPAAVPDSPAFPPKSLLLLASGVFGLGLGVFNAIVADMIQQRPLFRRKPRPAAPASAGAPAAGRSLLAATAASAPPAMAAPSVDPSDILRDRVLVALSVSDPEVAGEASVQLARDAAREGYSTLFIDLASDHTPGLAELSTGHAALSDILSRDPHSAAHVVYAGDQRGGFSVRGFREALAVFVDSYDRLVINAGLLYGEANEMAAEIVDAAEHVVLVVPYGALSPQEASAYAELTSTGALAVTVLALDDMPLESAA